MLKGSLVGLGLVVALVAPGCGGSSSSPEGPSSGTCPGACGAGKVCRYPSTACDAVAVCVDPPSETCAAVREVCGCDGKTRMTTEDDCTAGNYGYVSTRFSRPGPCESDAGGGG